MDFIETDYDLISIDISGCGLCPIITGPDCAHCPNYDECNELIDEDDEGE
jgi:hypothetical protein